MISVKEQSVFKNWFKKKAPEDFELEENLDQAGELDETEAAEYGLEAALDLDVADQGEIGESVEIEEIVDESQWIESEPNEVIEADVIEVPAKAGGFFKRLFSGLDKTRKQFTDRIDQLINNYGQIDDALFDELEEILITADIGMDTTMRLIEKLKEALKLRKINDASMVKDVLKDVMAEMLSTADEAKLKVDSPSVVLVIGVNGAGKTTSIGKISNLLKSEGKSVLLAAADTFRAAAIDQLVVWGKRSGVEVIAQAEGSDPASVVFDAIQAAKSRKSDVLIVDTAGRLHNKVNLMNELAKIFRIIDREYPGASREVLLVLDATTGQNAIQQAKLFQEVAPITGVVLTKLDGTAKGGFIFAVKETLGIPVKLIGVGEGIMDLQHFDPMRFAHALMDSDAKAEAEAEAEV